MWLSSVRVNVNKTRRYDWLTYWIHVLCGAGVGALLGLVLWLRSETHAREMHRSHALVPLGFSLLALALNCGAWAGYRRDHLWVQDMSSNDDEPRDPPIRVKVAPWCITGLTLGVIGIPMVNWGVQTGRRLMFEADPALWVVTVVLPVATGLVALCGTLYFLVQVVRACGESRCDTESK